MAPVIDPLKKLLDPNAAAAILGADNPLPPMFQRGTIRDVAGNVSPDYTPSVYNQQNDAALAADEAARTQREQEAAQARLEQTNPDLQAAKADRLATLLAPTKLQGENQLAVEKEKTRGAQAVEQTKADLQGKLLADREAAAEAKLNAPTNQIRTAAKYASNAMDLIGATDTQVNDPEIAPYIGNIVGRIAGIGSEGASLPNDFAVSMTADPHLQQKIGAFGLRLAATVSAIARAHNQRGATKELMQEFQHQIRTSQTPAQLHGALSASHELMQGYAANDPSLGIKDPYGVDPFGQTLGVRADPAGIR